MPFNTASVAANTTPLFLKTFLQHFLDKPDANSPRHQLAYDEALVLVRRFLEYGSRHTIEQVQAFTANKIPTPSWVSKTEVAIPQKNLDEAAAHIKTDMGEYGAKIFGGTKWWQYRLEALHCEWIEMKKDQRKRELATDHSTDRVILYIHGGAYYFGSVDEHRYQIQRHARKLGGRALAVNYRLAPQFPCPCGLQDNLAAYLYLLESHKPENIIISGDSAGGGMTAALLCLLRDQNIPLPAAGVMISPWVDLTHGFPSILGDSAGDYIPSHGFQHKPSMLWPPPTATDIAAAQGAEVGASSTHDDDDDDASVGTDSEAENADVVDNQTQRLGFSVETPSNPAATQELSDRLKKISMLDEHTNEAQIMVDGKLVTIEDQIQIYATNRQLHHRYVSPVAGGSLGGLCPVLIMAGGSELLRDEIIYLAHKAADPKRYPSAELFLKLDPNEQAKLDKYPPTQVHLQVYDDCCHVTPTIAMCRPAKYMYRSIANFSLWALARKSKAQQDSIIQFLRDANLFYEAADPSDDEGSDVADQAHEAAQHPRTARSHSAASSPAGPVVTVSGIEPLYTDNMIRERVTIRGVIRPMEDVSQIECLNLDRNSIAVIKPGPVQRFMEARRQHDKKYRKRKAQIQRRRAREYARAKSEGFKLGDFGQDHPPPTAIAGRADFEDAVKLNKQTKGKSGGLINNLFSFVSSRRDKDKINLREDDEKVQATAKDSQTAPNISA
ncbi:hypothetical protein PYCC9005_004096 [Savitreella phatthalungensis]